MLWHTLYSWLVVFFSWPNGSIWSNILADPIVWLFGLFLGVERIKKHLDGHHAERLAQAERHHEAQMDKLHEIHKQVQS